MRLGWLLLLAGWVSPAWAHDTGDARASLQVDAQGGVALELKVARVDVAELLGLPDDAPDAALDALLDTEVPMRLSSWLNLAAEPTPCLWDAVTVGPAGVRGLTITAQGLCPPVAELTVAWPAALHTRLNVKLTASVTPFEGEARWITLDRENNSVIVPLRAPPAASAPSFLRLGIEHMLTGWDHLAFLLALLLACARLRRLLMVVTGFTVAHSVSLALGVTGVVTIAPAVIEPIIAGSIAVAAAAALARLLAGRLAWPGSGRPSPRPVVELALCLGFGLVHGLGFAGLLAELAPQLDQVFVPLLAFNVGVELAQIAVVSVTFPLLVWVGRSRFARPAFGTLLVGLVGLGAVVAVLRIVA